MDMPELKACLRAVFQPSTPDREPLVKSRSIRHAIARLECEATELKAAAHDRPADNIKEAIEQIVGEQ